MAGLVRLPGMGSRADGFEGCELASAGHCLWTGGGARRPQPEFCSYLECLLRDGCAGAGPAEVGTVFSDIEEGGAWSSGAGRDAVCAW